MMASTRSLDLCFIFTIIHHNTVITTVRKHGSRLERFELIQLVFVTRDTYSTLQGLFPVCGHVVETSNGLRLKLESLSFCCALSSRAAQRRDRVWCVFWRPAALSTLRPPVRTDTMEAERLRVTEKGGRVVRKGGSLHPGKKERERERETDEEREKERRGGGGSSCGQCPRLEERALCSRLPDRDWGCWLMTFYGHNMQSHQLHLVKIQFSYTKQGVFCCCCRCHTKNDAVVHVIFEFEFFYSKWESGW